MALRTITAVFTAADAPEVLAREAAQLARHRDAHLTGVTVTADPLFYPAIASYMTPEVLAQIETERGREAEAARAAFEAAIAAEGVRGNFRVVHAGQLPLAEHMLEHGRAADLVVMGRPERQVDHLAALHEQVIRGLGRPFLLLPAGKGPGALHSRALVGWSPTREAARAAFDALLLLEPGAELTLLNVGQRGDHDLSDGPMTDLAAALARHEVSVTVTHRTPKPGGVAALIEAEAREIGAGFVATGAFGHSRAYDFVIGAVSRHLLASCPLPVLFSK